MIQRLALPGVPVQEGNLHPNVDSNCNPHLDMWEVSPLLQVKEGGPHLQKRVGGHHRHAHRGRCVRLQVKVAPSRSQPLHLQRSDSRPQRMPLKSQPASYSHQE